METSVHGILYSLCECVFSCCCNIQNRLDLTPVESKLTSIHRYTHDSDVFTCTRVTASIQKKKNSCTTSEQRSRESNGVCVCTMSSYLPLSRSSASLSPHVPDPALSGRKTILNKPNSAQTIFPSCLAEAILTINVFA